MPVKCEADGIGEQDAKSLKRRRKRGKFSWEGGKVESFLLLILSISVSTRLQCIDSIMRHLKTSQVWRGDLEISAMYTVGKNQINVKNVTLRKPRKSGEEISAM